MEIKVGYTEKGIIIVTFTRNGEMQEYPLTTGETWQLAQNLLQAVPIAQSMIRPILILPPKE